MTCCLTPSTTAEQDFTATVGCIVTLRLKGPDGVGVASVNVLYAGNEVVSDPPQFEITAGKKVLVVVAEASQPGATLRLIESCDGSNELVLDEFDYDPMNPARAYIIQGISGLGSSI